jgi:hypothetical protein
MALVKTAATHALNTEDESPETILPAHRSLSVVVATFGECEDPAAFLEAYRIAMADIAMPLEFILVGEEGTRDRVEKVRQSGFDWCELVAIETSVAAGEDEALKLALSRATGDLILTVAGRKAASADTLKALFERMGHHDLVVGVSDEARADSQSAFRKRMLHWSIRKLFGRDYTDLFCRFRLGKRDVFEASTVLGVRQHFIPLVADWRGYDVVELPIPAAEARLPARSVWRPRLRWHYRALIDLLMLFVVLKFLDRPLRFFSAIGAPLFIIGLLITGYLVIARLLQLTSLADRPLLTFGVLLIVLGVQVIAIGLVGEIIVYTSNRRSKSYEIDRIVNLHRDGESD